MKSLGYLFSKNPKYFDDCVDFADRAEIIDVSVNLVTTEIVTTMCIGRQLVAQFQFRFADRKVRCEKIMGGIMAHETEKKQLKSLYAANRRLEHCLNRIRSNCPEIQGADKRFDDTLIYRFSARAPSSVNEKKPIRRRAGIGFGIPAKS